MKENPIRTTLAAGKPSLGGWLNLASPLAAEVMASTGYEWLALDTEHTTFDLEMIAHCFRAIEARGAVPLVRAWEDDSVTLARILDAGAWGIIVPHVSTPAQAEKVCQAMRFPPRGTRSAGTGRFVTFAPDYVPTFNDQVLVIPQIEDMEGIENAEAIARVEGVDIGFIGPKDLSMSMGVEPGHPDHEAAIQKLREGFQRAGKPCGLPARDLTAARQRIADGFRFLDVASDLRLLQGSAEQTLRALTDA